MAQISLLSFLEISQFLIWSIKKRPSVFPLPLPMLTHFHVDLIAPLRKHSDEKLHSHYCRISFGWSSQCSVTHVSRQDCSQLLEKTRAPTSDPVVVVESTHGRGRSHCPNDCWWQGEELFSWADISSWYKLQNHTCSLWYLKIWFQIIFTWNFVFKKLSRGIIAKLN